MSLRQIAEVIGKSEGYIKSLFVGVNELNRDKDYQNLISDAGITIRAIAETKPIKNKEQRLTLLEERKEGKINREQMRKKVTGLSGAIPEKYLFQKPKEDEKPRQIPIFIKAFPELNQIAVSLETDETKEQFKELEKDIRLYFSANKAKYRIDKIDSQKEQG
jgi:hypothetical protein